MNGDRLDDVVVGTAVDRSGNSVVVRTASSAGTFPSGAANSTSLAVDSMFPIQAVGVADFDGINGPDIAALAANSIGTLQIFLQQAPAPTPTPTAVGLRFTPGPTLEAGGFAADMAVAVDDPGLGTLDFDGDPARVPDLAVVVTRGQAPQQQGKLLVYLGSRDGGGVSFQQSSDVDAGTNPTALALGRLDSDDNLDVVVADGTENVIRFFLGDGKGHLVQAGAPRATGPEPSDVLLADVDFDGSLDVITTNKRRWIDHDLPEQQPGLDPDGDFDLYAERDADDLGDPYAVVYADAERHADADAERHADDHIYPHAHRRAHYHADAWRSLRLRRNRLFDRRGGGAGGPA